MYYDSITIDPVTYGATLPIIVGATYGILAITALILWLLQRRAKKRDLKPKYIKRYSTFLKTIGVAAAVASLSFWVLQGVQSDKAEYEVVDRQLAAMTEQLGYNPVSITLGDDDARGVFTARTSDGAYISGRLIEIEPGTYILKVDEY